MRFRRLILMLLAVMPLAMSAQYDIKKEKISTWMFEVSYAYQFPGMDTCIATTIASAQVWISRPHQTGCSALTAVSYQATRST